MDINKKIKSKNDAREILLNLQIYESNPEIRYFQKDNQITFKDKDICMINDGNTEIIRISESTYSTLSYGQNWSDMKKEERDIEFCVNKLYKNRKSWNNEIRLVEKEMSFL